MEADSILKKVTHFNEININNEIIDGNVDLNILTTDEIKINQKEYTKKFGNSDKVASPKAIYINNINFSNCSFKGKVNLIIDFCN